MAASTNRAGTLRGESTEARQVPPAATVAFLGGSSDAPGYYDERLERSLANCLAALSFTVLAVAIVGAVVAWLVSP